MKKNVTKVLALLLVVVLTLGLFAGCGGSSGSNSESASSGDGAKTLKVGFVNTDTAETSTWTAAHKVGYDYLVEKMPDLETVWIENVSDSGSECAEAIDKLVEQGCNLIFTTSYGFMGPTQEKAKEYPDVLFFHNQSNDYGDAIGAPNMGVYDIRDYEAVFLTGYLTQLVAAEKDPDGANFMAYVGSNPMPTVLRACNAFALGAKYANPDLQMKAQFVYSWYDPTNEKEAANSLINDGAKGFGMQVGSPAVIQACEEAGLPCAGFSSDMQEYGPNSVVTSFLWNWGAEYEYIVKGVMDGTITKGEDIFLGIADGCGGVAEYNKAIVSDEIAAKADEVMEQLKSGEITVFYGDMADNLGNIHGEGADALTDEEIRSMDWLVDFVEGTIN